MGQFMDCFLEIILTRIFISFQLVKLCKRGRIDHVCFKIFVTILPIARQSILRVSFLKDGIVEVIPYTWFRTWFYIRFGNVSNLWISTSDNNYISVTLSWKLDVFRLASKDKIWGEDLPSLSSLSFDLLTSLLVFFSYVWIYSFACFLGVGIIAGVTTLV